MAKAKAKTAAKPRIEAPDVKTTIVKTLRISPPRYGYIDVTVGNKDMDSTLVVHAKGQKMLQYLYDRGQNNVGGRDKVKEKRNIELEYLESMYYMPGHGHDTKKPLYAILAAGFKKGMVRAAKPIDGIHMTDVNQSVFVYDEIDGLVPLKCTPPHMRTDVVLIGKGANKTPELRYRGEFDEWSCNLKIRYNADFFSSDEILNLLSHAGLSVGWGEMRPEKGYSHGQYTIQGNPVVKEPK